MKHFKFHKIGNIDTLADELDTIISDLEVNNEVMEIDFIKILDTDVVKIEYMSLAEIQEQRKKNQELLEDEYDTEYDTEDDTEEIEQSTPELINDFLQENKIDYNKYGTSQRHDLRIKITEWLTNEKGIDQSSSRLHGLLWEFDNHITQKWEIKLRENIPELQADLYTFCKENNLKKLTKSLMIGYFEEKNVWIPVSITNILYTKVNLELSKNP